MIDCHWNKSDSATSSVFLLDQLGKENKRNETQFNVTELVVKMDV